MNRRTFVQGSLAGSVLGGLGCTGRSPVAAPSAFTSLSELTSLLRAGQTTAATLTRQCLQRIDAIDKAGPALNSVIEVNPEAFELATSLDKQKHLGPLHGIPVLIKDNIDTADAMQTTAGSLALAGSRPAQDAGLVKRLRTAGAILLGKTNLSEWANIRSPHSTSGWSARGGLTLNPHKLSHTPSGSSSGSAAAVAAGLVAAAIGTETDGSIVSPASTCGIVGFKPTVGLVSRAGIIPITRWQDTAGPMARSVRDAALLLNVIQEARPGGHVTDFTTGLTPDCLRGKRLGVVRNLAGHHAGVLALFEGALEKLRSAGAILIDPVELPNESRISSLSFTAMLTELREDLNAYLAGRAAEVNSLARLIEFNNQHRDQEMPWFGQEFFEAAEKLGTPEALATGASARAQARELAGPQGIDAALKTHALDALICPTNDPAGLTRLSKGDADVRCCSTPAAVAGYPHLTVPMGLVEDLPVGLSFFGTAWSDALILNLGHGFEQLQPGCKPPRFLA